MKKAFMISILMLFLFASVGNVFGEEMAKEGSGSAHTGHSGTWNLIPLDDNNGIVTWEQTGIVLDVKVLGVKS